jgi:hypothetical protein
LGHKFARLNRDGFHRFNTVHHQVDNHLLQLDPITQDQGSACANRIRKHLGS